MKKKVHKVRTKKNVPWYKKRWFLMLMGLAVFAFILLSPPSPQNSDVLGASSNKGGLWSSVMSFFGKNSTNTRKPAVSNSAASTSTATTTPSTTTSTSLPLGDGKYTNTPKKGYIYTCQTSFDATQGGAGTDGPWINTAAKTWDPTAKVAVSGSHTWANAQFSAVLSGETRTLTGNGLPLSDGTGTYPVALNDPAYAYDKNPNMVKAQTINISLPANPTLLSTPQCINGEVGIMLSGVPLFDGFDAGGRDATAHEVQDVCEGHPQNTGMYHYHGPSKCLKDEDGLLGYALDGFGIYTATSNTGKELTTTDLDECHGTTSEIVWDGKKVKMYHYVMTKDFPYSVSCFRGKKMVDGPLDGGKGQSGQLGSGQSGQGKTGGMPMPSGKRPAPRGGQGQNPPPSF